MNKLYFNYQNEKWLHHCYDIFRFLGYSYFCIKVHVELIHTVDYVYLIMSL